MTTRLQQLRMKRSEIEDEIVALAEAEDLSAGQAEHFERLTRQRDRVTRDLVELEERAERIADIKKRTHRSVDGMPEYDLPNDGKLERSQELALRQLERSNLSASAGDRFDELVRGDSHFGKWAEVHGRPEYVSAFGKIIAANDAGLASAMMTDAERGALSDSFSVRAQAEGTTTTGGFAIPVFIDPSVILTDQETSNPFLTIARQVNVNTSAWKGISAAGVSWSFDAEASTVSDDSITIAQPSVTVFMARGFIPYSIEIGEDWPGFQSEMARLLALGYDELIIDKFTRGSGTGEPRGLLTALATSSPTVIVTSMTDGAFGQEDVYATWKALPQKYRRRANWMMNVGTMNRVRQFGAANVYHAYTVSLPDGAVDMLMSRAVYENPYFPDFTGTTGSENRMVCGDFSNYVVARRSGMTIELVPQLFDTTSNRPTGQRGWFAYARIGGNSVNDRAFALQANT